MIDPPFLCRYDNSCKYHDLGETLLKYLWSRKEFDKCQELIRNVPAMNDVMCKFYLNEGKLEKVLPIVMSYGESGLLEDIGKYLDEPAWEKVFEIFSRLQSGEFICSNCFQVNFIENVLNRHFFYTWNCFLNISLQFLKPCTCLDLVLQFSDQIPSDAIDREFYKTCLMKCK